MLKFAIAFNGAFSMIQLTFLWLFLETNQWVSIFIFIGLAIGQLYCFIGAIDDFAKERRIKYGY